MYLVIDVVDVGSDRAAHPRKRLRPIAKSAGRQLTVVADVLPIDGLVAGPLCLTVGVLLRRRRRQGSAEEPAREPEHAAT